MALMDTGGYIVGGFKIWGVWVPPVMLILLILQGYIEYLLWLVTLVTLHAAVPTVPTSTRPSAVAFQEWPGQRRSGWRSWEETISLTNLMISLTLRSYLTVFR